MTTSDLDTLLARDILALLERPNRDRAISVVTTNPAAEVGPVGLRPKVGAFASKSASSGLALSRP